MDARISSLADRYWEAVLDNSPGYGTLVGDHRRDAELEDVSREAEDVHIAVLDGIVAEARSMDRNDLTTDDVVTLDTLIFEAGTGADHLRSRSIEFLVDPMLGAHMDLINYIPQMPATEAAHLDAYVGKASKVGRLMDQVAKRHREGADAGRLPVAIHVQKVIAQLDSYLAAPIGDDPFMRITPPPDMDAGAVAEWLDRMQHQVVTVVRPAFSRYRDSVADLLPLGRPEDKVGLCWLPDGEETYQKAIYRYTSLHAGADEIHDIGLGEIADLADQYRALGGPVLGTTDLTAIYHRLRSDMSLRFENQDQVREAAETALARANEATPDWFGIIPETPCIVMAMPEIGAEDQTIAYYLPPAADGSRPGIYFINLTEPTTRTRFEAEALAYHESVPGHHFQLALAQEMESLPAFRKFGLATAYVEGWGLYTERLADEMGLYSGDLERMGVLSFDSWRAGRLVVDTGMHARGWSRQEAIDYLMDNSPQAPNNIVNEIDRYIGYSGQALAYKMGQREILTLRDEARSVMGPQFDIKGFHDTVLTAGPVPLGVLGDIVTRWSGS